MATSYWVVYQHHRRIFFIINPRQGNHVDEVIVVNRCRTTNECTVTHYTYYEGIRSAMFNDGLVFVTIQIEFTSGSVPIVTFVDQNNRLLDDEQSNQVSMEIARYMLWHESRRATNEILEANMFDHLIKVSGVSEEKEEICVICYEDYKVDDVIGTLECEHAYHEACIKRWLVEKNICPICRAAVLSS